MMRSLPLNWLQSTLRMPPGADLGTTVLIFGAHDLLDYATDLALEGSQIGLTALIWLSSCCRTVGSAF